MLITLGVISCLLYSLGALFQGLNLAEKQPFRKVCLLGLGFSAVSIHAFVLHRWIDVPTGQNLAFLNMLSLAAWVIALLIVLAALRKPIESLSILIFPLAALSIILIMLFPTQHVVDTSTKPSALFHILLSVLSFGVLCMAALQTALILIQERRLRLSGLGSIIQKLPPIEMMVTFLFQIMTVGFLLLTIVLITSILLFFHAIAHPLIFSKVVLTFVAWIILGVLLWGRFFRGWRGKRVIYFTLISVGLLMATYFGGQSLLR